MAFVTTWLTITGGEGEAGFDIRVVQPKGDRSGRRCLCINVVFSILMVAGSDGVVFEGEDS